MKRIVISAAVLSLAVAGVSQAQAAPAVNKVNGGGQITNVFDAEGNPTEEQITSGPGSTIAFSAQSQGEEGSDAKGQFQYVNRSKGKGQAQEVVHGTVTCVVVLSRPEGGGSGGLAVIGGVSRAGEQFRIDVTDNGSGGEGTDMLRVSRGAAAQDGGDDDENDTSLCDREEEMTNLSLGRGNVTIHKEKATGSEAAPEGGTKSTGKGGKGGEK